MTHPATTPDLTRTIHQSFAVTFDYPVVFGCDLFEANNPTLAEILDRRGESRCHRAVIYLDAGLAQAQPALAGKLKAYFAAHADTMQLLAEPILVPGGAGGKADYQLLRDVMKTLGDLRLDRQSYVIALGGGSMLDAVGLAASLVHRGVRLVRCPSTVLSQNDAGLGVKNGLDEHGQKNFLGTFAPPFAVLCDANLLTTLSDEDWTGGISEAFKVAIIKDAEFFAFLCEAAPALASRDLNVMRRLIVRAGEIHLDHIATSGDAFEFGSARPLDFGHWAAHRLEILSAHEIPHGQAVAIGIAIDTVYAQRQGLLSATEQEAILQGLSQSGLPIYHDLLAQRDPAGRLDVLVGLDQFQEHLGGQLCVTLPHHIGSRVEVHEMDRALLAACIEFLRDVEVPQP